MARAPDYRWCPNCRKFAHCKEYEVGAFAAAECPYCKKVFTNDFERRGLFHYLWGLNINCCNNCSSAYQKDVWSRLAELIDSP